MNNEYCHSYLMNKAQVWSYYGRGDYPSYIINTGRVAIANEFRNDQAFQAFSSYILNYAKGQERNTVTTIVREALDPDLAVENILVGAILDAMGYTDIGDKLVKLALAGSVLVLILAAFKDK